MAVDTCKRPYLSRNLSTGHLLHLASQVRQHPNELLSLTATEQMWDGDPVGVHWTSPSALKLASGKTTAGGFGAFCGGSRLLGGQTIGHSSCSALPPRRRTVWSPESVDMQSSSRHDRGVSSCTKRENSSQEEATVRLDSSFMNKKGVKGEQASVQHDPVPAEPATKKQTMDMIEAEFNEEVSAMENQIAQNFKSLHMNRFSKEEAEAKVMEEREAEKRRREAELRKARMKEKAARDPHRKVQLKLENRRRFGMDDLDHAKIPTMNVNFHTDHGSKMVQLVDVHALRNKCKGLSEGIHSVPKLVELQQREDYHGLSQSAAVGLGALPRSISVPNLPSE